MAQGGETFRFTRTELIAGATAGFAEHVCMFPFDVVKTRMQSEKGSTSVRAVFRHICKEERLTHLYRGCVPVLTAAVPAHAVYFGLYEALKRVFGDNTPLSIALAASGGTIGHDAVSTPFDVVKQRMQMDETRRFTNSLQCARHIARTEGLRSFYLSLPTTVAMNVPHFATYWLVYESTMMYFHGGEHRVVEEELTTEYMVGGFLAGGAAAIVSFPLDVVKTHLQLGQQRSFKHAVRSLAKGKPMREVFRGVVPRILYTAPSGAIMMVTYESTKNALALLDVVQ